MRLQMLRNLAPTTYAVGAKHKTHSKPISELTVGRYNNPIPFLSLTLVSSGSLFLIVSLLLSYKLYEFLIKKFKGTYGTLIYII
jgi:hypothetical protein